MFEVIRLAVIKMLDGVKQSGSYVGRDQIGGDKTENNYIVKITKNLSPAVDPIRKYSKADKDPNNTILIRKLRDGEFNKTSVDNAINKKAKYLQLQIKQSKTQSGRSFFEDAKENLTTLINTKYIANMAEGETLRIDMTEIVSTFAAIVDKYKDVMSIDEAMVEGMLYVATSECAVKWKIEGFEDGD
jgi:hypothetical protein